MYRQIFVKITNIIFTDNPPVEFCAVTCRHSEWWTENMWLTVAFCSWSVKRLKATQLFRTSPTTCSQLAICMER